MPSRPVFHSRGRIYIYVIPQQGENQYFRPLRAEVSMYIFVPLLGNAWKTFASLFRRWKEPFRCTCYEKYIIFIPTHTCKLAHICTPHYFLPFCPSMYLDIEHEPILNPCRETLKALFFIATVRHETQEAALTSPHFFFSLFSPHSSICIISQYHK